MVGFHDYVAKFDRHGLVAALKEQAAEATPDFSSAASGRGIGTGEAA
jgi:hypothetical protein